MSQHNQQPYYGYNQHNSGPPQPQWQAAQRANRYGWGDPRPTQASPTVPTPITSFHGAQGYNTLLTQTLPPPPPPPPGGFPTSPQQQVPNAFQNDTSMWGVKYNQGAPNLQSQDHTLRPPLPPRPSSAQAGPQHLNQPQLQPQGAWNIHAPVTKPPTPPPRPPEYAPPPAVNQYYPHEQYSHQTTSHQYEPQQLHNQQWPDAQQSLVGGPGTWQQPYSHTGQEEPVSPLESHQQQNFQQRWSVSTPQPPIAIDEYGHLPPRHAGSPSQQRPSSVQVTKPSTLGSGGPPEWERFSHYTTNYQPPPQRQQTPSHAPEQHHQQQHQSNQSYNVTPDQIHATPVQSNPGPALLQNPAQNNAWSAGTAVQDQQGEMSHNLQQKSPDRLGGDSAVFKPDSLRRSGTIDSVIQAWASPETANSGRESPEHTRHPQLASRQSLQSVSRLIETKNAAAQTDFPPLIKTETVVETKTETRDIDPYEDLKNEYRTSLNRYVTMLRLERSAATEKEKLGIVMDFVNREVKLRSVMFNAEPAELVPSKELAELRQIAEKARRQEVAATSVRDAPAASSNPEQIVRKSSNALPPLKTNTILNQQARDDGFVVVDRDEDDTDEYSPGGRPRVKGAPKTTAQRRSKSPILPVNISQPNTMVQGLVQPLSPASNAPMTLEDYVTPEQHFGPGSRAPSAAPIQQSHGNVVPKGMVSTNNQVQHPPIPFQPARPAYLPFKYTEVQMPTQTTVNNNNPADAAYSKLRHDQATDSGRILSQELPSLKVTAPDRAQSSTPSRARQQQEEAFVGLLRQHSKAIKKPSVTPPPPDAPAPLRIGTPLKRRPSLPPMVKSTEALRDCLPRSTAQLSLSLQSQPALAPIVAEIAKFSDDFGFIHATVVAWDKDNRIVRQQLETERADRESESQAHIDGLFHDNQIGYADIASLEEDSKLEEASRKYKEDQAELDSFVRGVFEKVADKIEKELGELETLRIRTLDVLDLDTQSASARVQVAVKSTELALTKASLATAMETMLQIYNKIEVRYTKIAEAHFERERRRKRLELSVLYTNGDTSGVKKLEKDFDKAQAMQVLSEARKRDERANKLMDSFDRAVVRGLAENQAWLDDMSNRSSLLRDLVLGAESNGPQGSNREELLYGPGGVKETIDRLHGAVTLVLQDSQDLIAMSSRADKLLNEADFAMFLAEAKIADASEQDFQKLRNEKTKEDAKLKDEFESRMIGVRSVPQDIFGYIKDVRDAVGNDPEHQTRLNQALEAAKMRNKGAELQEPPAKST